MYGFEHTARSAKVQNFMYFKALLVFCYFLPNREIGLSIWGRIQRLPFCPREFGNIYTTKVEIEISTVITFELID